MSVINNEVSYKPETYLTRVHAGSYELELELEPKPKPKPKPGSDVVSIDVAGRWEEISKIFSTNERFDKLSWNDDIKMSSLAIYMLYRINDKKFVDLTGMLKSRDIKGLARYVDKNKIPLICQLKKQASSDEAADSGKNSLGEKMSSSDLSGDKIASSSEGSAKFKRRKKKISESSGSDSSMYIFTQRQERSIEEQPYMHKQRNAWFTVIDSRFKLSEEATRNLRGERGEDHFVDLKHINEAMEKLLKKSIVKEYAPTYRIGSNQFLKMVVRRYGNQPLVLITCYYKTLSEVAREEQYKSYSDYHKELEINKITLLNGKSKKEYVRIS